MSSVGSVWRFQILIVCDIIPFKVVDSRPIIKITSNNNFSIRVVDRMGIGTVMSLFCVPL